MRSTGPRPRADSGGMQLSAGNTKKNWQRQKRNGSRRCAFLGADFKRRSQQLYNPVQGTDQDEKTAVPLSALSLDTVIAYLIRLHHTGGGDSETLRWKQTAKMANDKVDSLQKEIDKLKQENKTLRNDYEPFVQIMNRARRLVTLEDDADRTAPVFTMERNGNLVSKEPPINH